MHRITLIVIVVGLSLAGSVAISSGHHGDDSVVGPYDIPTPTETPPPANAPGQSEEMPVVGADGNLVRCPQDGKPLMVTLAEAQAAPNLGESELVPTDEPGAAVYEVTETSVPRCGPEGGGSNDEAVWVPEHVGVQSVTAPKRFLDEQ